MTPADWPGGVISWMPPGVISTFRAQIDNIKSCAVETRTTCSG